MTTFLVLLVLAQSPQTIMDRAVADFESGRFAESAAAFDSLAKALPDEAPYLWQRGIFSASRAPSHRRRPRRRCCL